jgi:hypothetical protein
VNGVLRFKVSSDPAGMTLRIADIEILMDGGFLPAIETGADAIKHRLINLGYGRRRLADWNDSVLSQAIRGFQRDHGLQVTGVADDEFKSKLKEMYGS